MEDGWEQTGGRQGKTGLAVNSRGEELRPECCGSSGWTAYVFVTSLLDSGFLEGFLPNRNSRVTPMHVGAGLLLDKTLEQCGGAA